MHKQSLALQVTFGHCLQDDDVYKSMTAQDKVALWEQGLCPGKQVSKHCLTLQYLGRSQKPDACMQCDRLLLTLASIVAKRTFQESSSAVMTFLPCPQVPCA